MPTLEEWMAGIARAEKAGDAEAAASLRADAQKELTGKGSTMANIGAGMQNMMTGARQLASKVGIGEGPSDEDIREQRQIAEAASGGTFGGKAAQLAGEIIPTLAIPGGTGARVLTRALGGPARMGVGRAAAGSALESGAVGALTPTTEDESRAGNIALGAAGGAVAPALVKTLSSAARMPGKVLEHARAAYGKGGQAAERIGGREVQELVERQAGDLQQFGGPQAYQPQTRAPQEFAPTTAAAFQNPELAALEKASRTANAPAWTGRDVAEAQKRWDYLNKSLRGEEDIAAATTRMDELKPRFSDISQRKLTPEVAAFGQKLEQATTSSAYRTNAVARAAVDEARRVLGGGPVNAEVLYGLRKNLTGGLKGTPGMTDEAVRAARGDPYIMSMVNDIDDVLERSAKAGKPGMARWREQYSGAAREAEGAKAEERLRRTFVNEQGQPVRGTTEQPTLTPHALRQAVEKTRTLKKGPGKGEDVFSKQASQAVQDIVTDLDKAGIVDQVRKAATLGGSDTAFNLTTLGVSGVLADLLATGGAATGGLLVRSLGKRNVEVAKQRILTEILQDPEKMRQFVQAAAQRSRQLATQQGVPVLPYGQAAAGAIAPALESEQ